MRFSDHTLTTTYIRVKLKILKNELKGDIFNTYRPQIRTITDYDVTIVRTNQKEHRSKRLPTMQHKNRGVVNKESVRMTNHQAQAQASRPPKNEKEN